MPSSTEPLLRPTAPLTPNQAKLLNHILGNPERAVFLTTAQLSQATGVSEATIVRLAQALGYSGYKELRQNLERSLMNRLDTVERLKSSAAGIHSVDDLMRTVIQQDLKNLTFLADTANPKILNQAALKMYQAPVIHILGLRSAYSLAVFLRSGLTLLGKKVRLLTPETWEFWRYVAQIGRRDLLLAISFPRYTRLTVEIVTETRRAGAVIISLTDSPLSPLAALSDYLLCTPCRIDSFIESYVPALSMLNALITGVGFLQGAAAVKHLRKMEKIWQKKQTYQKAEVRVLPTWAASNCTE